MSGEGKPEKDAPSNNGPSRDTLQSWAVGTLQEWFEGWTDATVDTGFMQYKIVHHEYTDTGVVFGLIGGFGVPNPEGVYEVVVKVKRRKK